MCWLGWEEGEGREGGREGGREWFDIGEEMKSGKRVRL